MHYLEEYKRWMNYSGLTDTEREEMVLLGGCEDAVKTAFSNILTFGTAGLRGICGMGTGRMNRYTVRRATQGLSAYLHKTDFNPSVVISYDSRLDSRYFAEETACVLTANGIKTYLFDSMMPVPVLSHAVLKLNCSAGIMITASHNPKEYNGYKVYNRNGGQILDAEAEAILSCIEIVDIFHDVRTLTLDEALEAGLVYVPQEIYTSYLDEMDKASSMVDKRELKIVYTPLNGSGLKPVSDILNRKGFDFFVVPEQEAEDGNFPTCPSPNPEKEEVYTLAEEYGRKQNADILLATDPDCDRVGVKVWNQNRYELLSGNEIGLLILHFICEMQKNLMFKNVYTSLVSTPLVDYIAQRHNISVKRTPVGFKYIGSLIARSPGSFLFGFEESNGYLMGSYARDKDGTAGVYIIAQMAAYYKARGKNLTEVLEEIYQHHGYMLDRTVSLEISGSDEMGHIMGLLRNKDAVYTAFPDLRRYTDYADETRNDLLAGMNLIQMDFADQSRIIVRPSGTEPKIKLYISASASTKADALKKQESITEKINQYLNIAGE